jgi:hypothetical protein
MAIVAGEGLKAHQNNKNTNQLLHLILRDLKREQTYA